VHKDVVIIGGGPAGFNCAKTVKKLFPKKSVLVITDREDSQIPCAVPYVLSGMLKPEENRHPLKKLEDLGIEVLIGRATAIDSYKGKVILEDGNSLSYEKLVIATGWAPNRLHAGNMELEGIFYPSVITQEVKQTAERIKKAEKILIVGAGLIGLNLSGLLKSNFPDKRVFLVEARDFLANGIFSKEVEGDIEKELERLGVELIKNNAVLEFEGKERVESAVLKDRRIEVDTCFISIGFRPNTSLAMEAGIETDHKGAIIVDSFMRTSVEGILACGDCVQHRSAIDGKVITAMFASVAGRDGRVAGVNIEGPEVKLEKVVPSGITQVGSLFVGFAGYTGRILKENSIAYSSTSSSATDGHPSALKPKEFKVKLYFDKRGKIIGGEVVGRSKSVSYLVELLKIFIFERRHAEEIVSLTRNAFPLLTPSPLSEPISECAVEFVKNWSFAGESGEG
jgi:NADPH-dependent 2,4-dienoyl-CoA reductase/sulfur reductase-like enzyme